MGKAVFLDHVDLCLALAGGILEGEVPLDKAVANLAGLTVGRFELVEDIFRLGSVAPDSHVRETVDISKWQTRFVPHTSTKAMRALEVINEMLVHPKLRPEVLNYLWESVKPKDLGWLEVFTKHLTVESGYAVLLNLPKTTSRNKAKVLVSVKVGEYLPESHREPIALIARMKGKVELLYKYTAWPCCHQVASAKSRENLMGTDLGL
ncbi:hypothetical protein IFT48_03460 [Pseudomonas fluorescens]|uniref:hypothetical protein n=1 Tax=Pseudomonas fluorescens TaxID=294 RepID=UPI001930D2E9|nr:hypothetical protein [Pseudomonas fluorescens]MBD8089027.1 hypothetical protein [Pseudomonas fluorescens]